MIALLEPTDMIAGEENKGSYGNRLALMEEFKALPFGAIWDKFCIDMGVPAGADWLEDIEAYEKNVLLKR